MKFPRRKQQQPLGSAHVVFGLQAGSEAKGKVAGWLAKHGNYDVAVSNFMPNAGHTFVKDNGDKIMVQTLPQSIVAGDSMEYVLSAGSAIELTLLFEEIMKFSVDPWNVYIDSRAVIVLGRHREAEATKMAYISSTRKGCGEALAGKVLRDPWTVLWADIVEETTKGQEALEEAFEGKGELWKLEAERILGKLKTNSKHHGRTHTLLNNALDSGENLLIEAPQGYDLDINHGVQYPYCTSRQTTPAQAVADAGIPMYAVTRVTAVARPYPIRVGNMVIDGVLVGSSGDYPTKEITWEEIAERSGTPREEITEMTTVTKKLRRVFETNMHEMAEAVRVTGTTDIALNFVNYIDYSNYGATSIKQLTDRTIVFINNLQEVTGVPVSYIGTGPKDGQVIDLMNPEQRKLYDVRVQGLYALGALDDTTIETK